MKNVKYRKTIKVKYGLWTPKKGFGVTSLEVLCLLCGGQSHESSNIDEVKRI